MSETMRSIIVRFQHVLVGKRIWIVTTLIFLMFSIYFAKVSFDRPTVHFLAPLPPLVALLESSDARCKLTIVFARESGRTTIVPVSGSGCPRRSTLWILPQGSPPSRVIEVDLAVATQITMPLQQRQLAADGVKVVFADYLASNTAPAGKIGSIIASGKIRRLGSPPQSAVSMDSSPATNPLSKPIPTIALTFDYDQSAYAVAYPIMKRYGLVGTWFLDPFAMDYPAPGLATSNQARELEAQGWEIGGYTRYQMVDLEKLYGPEIAAQHMTYVRDAMADKGFVVRSLAPSSRQWNAGLRDISNGIFDNVRVASQLDTFEPQPLADPLYIDKGGSTSLSENDNFQTLLDRLDQLQKSEGIWIVVAHKISVGNSGPTSLNAGIFEAFCAEIDRRRRDGSLRVATVSSLQNTAFRAVNNHRGSK